MQSQLRGAGHAHQHYTNADLRLESYICRTFPSQEGTIQYHHLVNSITTGYYRSLYGAETRPKETKCVCSCNLVGVFSSAELT